MGAGLQRAGLHRHAVARLHARALVRRRAGVPRQGSPLWRYRALILVQAMGLYRDQGVVLRTIRLGESDRIVTFVTQAHGKVRAVAKGVRKTKSRFGGRLEPTSHVSLLLYEGRELDIVTQAEALDHFRVIREDLDRLGRATTMLEAVDQVAQERQQSTRLYQMLGGAPRALSAHNAPLLVPAFFLKLLALEGLQPILDGCTTCGAPG